MIYNNLKKIENDIKISRKPGSGLNNKIKDKRFKQKLKKWSTIKIITAIIN